MTWNWLTVYEDSEEILDLEFYPDFLPGGAGAHIGEALVNLESLSTAQIEALRRGETVYAGGGAALEYKLVPSTVNLNCECGDYCAWCRPERCRPS